MTTRTLTLTFPEDVVQFVPQQTRECSSVSSKLFFHDAQGTLERQLAITVTMSPGLMTAPMSWQRLDMVSERPKGLTVIGTMGILVAAKQRNVIASVSPAVLDAMISYGTNLCYAPGERSTTALRVAGYGKRRIG
jgi:hypothetical protein